MGGSLEDGLAVVGDDERHEQGEAAEVDAPVRESHEQRRMSPRRARDGNARECLRLREMKRLRAVREHRWKGAVCVQPARVGFADVRNQLRFRGARLRDEPLQAAEELVVRNGLQGSYSIGFHVCNIGSRSSALPTAKGRPW
jgi:hypothetical protein